MIDDKKNGKKRLRLGRETIARLLDRELSLVAGGVTGTCVGTGDSQPPRSDDTAC